MSSSSSSRTILLKSSDGETFEMEDAVLQLSLIIKHMIEDDDTKNIIPLPNVAGNILSKIFEYCRKHVNNADDDDALRSFDSEFINVDEATLFHLGNAARFLDIKSLSSLIGEALAERRRKRRTAVKETASVSE